jgi:hypothetical protein
LTVTIPSTPPIVPQLHRRSPTTTLAPAGVDLSPPPSCGPSPVAGLAGLAGLAGATGATVGLARVLHQTTPSRPSSILDSLHGSDSSAKAKAVAPPPGSGGGGRLPPGRPLSRRIPTPSGSRRDHVARGLHHGGREGGRDGDDGRDGGGRCVSPSPATHLSGTSCRSDPRRYAPRMDDRNTPLRSLAGTKVAMGGGGGVHASGSSTGGKPRRRQRNGGEGRGGGRGGGGDGNGGKCGNGSNGGNDTVVPLRVGTLSFLTDATSGSHGIMSFTGETLARSVNFGKIDGASPRQELANPSKVCRSKGGGRAGRGAKSGSQSRFGETKHGGGGGAGDVDFSRLTLSQSPKHAQ